MRTKIVAGNWKMNKNLTESLSLISEVRSMVRDEVRHDVEVMIFPPYISLASANKLLEGANLKLGAQNCYHEKNGAYTGEVSLEMLKSVGVTNVLVGHSERRAIFGEDNALLAKKTSAILEAGLTPIYCCGETIENREDNSFFKVIETQISEGVFHLHEDQFKNIIIAYEPVWAIGTGMTASKEQAQEMHAYIRNLVSNKYGETIADSIRILYGGSVKPDNAQDLFSSPDIDGGLIGGASLKSRDFVEIVKASR